MFDRLANMKNKYEIIIGTIVVLLIGGWIYVVLALWVGTQPHIWIEWNPGLFGDSFGVLACVFSAGAFVYASAAYYSERKEQAQRINRETTERHDRQLTEHQQRIEDRELHIKSLYTETLARAFDLAAHESRDRFTRASIELQGIGGLSGASARRFAEQVGNQLLSGHFDVLPQGGAARRILDLADFCLEPFSDWLNAASQEEFDDLLALHKCYSTIMLSILGSDGPLLMWLFEELDERWGGQDWFIAYKPIVVYVKKYNSTGWARFFETHVSVVTKWSIYLNMHVPIRS